MKFNWLLRGRQTKRVCFYLASTVEVLLNKYCQNTNILQLFYLQYLQIATVYHSQQPDRKSSIYCTTQKKPKNDVNRKITVCYRFLFQFHVTKYIKREETWGTNFKFYYFLLNSWLKLTIFKRNVIR